MINIRFTPKVYEQGGPLFGQAKGTAVLVLGNSKYMIRDSGLSVSDYEFSAIINGRTGFRENPGLPLASTVDRELVEVLHDGNILSPEAVTTFGT